MKNSPNLNNLLLILHRLVRLLVVRRFPLFRRFPAKAEHRDQHNGQQDGQDDDSPEPGICGKFTKFRLKKGHGFSSVASSTDLKMFLESPLAAWNAFSCAFFASNVCLASDWAVSASAVTMMLSNTIPELKINYYYLRNFFLIFKKMCAFPTIRPWHMAL